MDVNFIISSVILTIVFGAIAIGMDRFVYKNQEKLFKKII